MPFMAKTIPRRPCASRMFYRELGGRVRSYGASASTSAACGRALLDVSRAVLGRARPGVPRLVEAPLGPDRELSH